MTVNITKPAINLRSELADLRKPTGVAGEAMLRADTPQEQFNLIGAGRRRLNINGAFNVWQRGTSFSSASTVTYHADRYQSYNSNNATGVATISKSTDAPSGFGSSYKLEVTTADTSLAIAAEYGLYHYFEGQDLQGIKKGTPDAIPLTISFWVKSSLTGKFVVELMDNDNSNRHCNKPYYVNAANTWEYKTITFPPDTTGVFDNDNGNSFHFNFWLGGGTNFSGSSLQENWGVLNQSARADGQVNVYGTNGATWQVTGVQLEVGSTASPFAHENYGDTLQKCQRYYQKTYDYGTAVGASTELGWAWYGTDYDVGITSVFQSQGIRFETTMRNPPTMVSYDSQGNSGKCTRYRVGVGPSNNNHASIDLITTKSFRHFGQGTAGTGNIAFHYTADAEL